MSYLRKLTFEMSLNMRKSLKQLTLFEHAPSLTEVELRFANSPTREILPLPWSQLKALSLSYDFRRHRYFLPQCPNLTSLKLKLHFPRISYEDKDSSQITDFDADEQEITVRRDGRVEVIAGLCEWERFGLGKYSVWGIWGWWDPRKQNRRGCELKRNH